MKNLPLAPPSLPLAAPQPPSTTTTTLLCHSGYIISVNVRIFNSDNLLPQRASMSPSSSHPAPLVEVLSVHKESDDNS